MGRLLSKPSLETPLRRPLSRTSAVAETLVGEEATIDGSSYWLIEEPLHAYWSDCDRRLRPHGAIESGDRDLETLIGRFPENTLFVDIETCGFSGSPLFLIGVAHPSERGMVLRQLLARTYAEEGAVLREFARMIESHPLLVTFNGKSFDWPFLRDRMSRHRLRHPPELEHVDLLHLGRRFWKGRFPNYRLQTLELYVCGRRRVGDIGGREVAQAYHDYVRTGRRREMKLILKHNALDVVTMVQLVACMLRKSVAPESRETVDSPSTTCRR
ncbi:DNA polymerase family B, exonuclease domain [Planctomycetes bacterium Pan216]|uniref:DNA polymerase family B, exonuclease domain n=1 Tax=Kolteria novifilia TaxID=2527975 RepID=A0A518B975_9BACT|nr:DNA polymerase family B, exonuclease domain [Planctomycetes bacterium Pan216]